MLIILIFIIIVILINIEKFTNVIGITATDNIVKYHDELTTMKTCNNCFNCGICKTPNNDYICLEGDINGPYSYGRWNYLSKYSTVMDNEETDSEIKYKNDVLCKKWLYNEVKPYSLYPNDEDTYLRM